MASRESDDPSEQTIPKTVYTSRDNHKGLYKLTHEGYNHDFVESDYENTRKIIDVECVFCCMVIRETVQISACGHSFCSSCWDDWLGVSDRPVLCPVDNQVVDLNDVFKDRKHDRIIRGLKVYCNNRDFGCMATPELRDIETHSAKCEYQTTRCSMQCGQEMLLWSLAEHIKKDCSRRIVSCDLCDIQLMFQDLQVHNDTCPMRVINCDLCESDNILMKDLSDHQRTVCPKFSTYCNFALIGCDVKVVREDLDNHHESHARQHLRLLAAAVSHLYTEAGTPLSLARDAAQQSVDSHLELAAPLWGRVGRDHTDPTMKWSELPEWLDENHRKSNQNSLSDSVSELVECNVQARMKSEQLSGVVEKLSKDNLEYEVKFEKVTENCREYKYEIEQFKIEVKRLSTENVELSRRLGNSEREMHRLAKEFKRFSMLSDDKRSGATNVVIGPSSECEIQYKELVEGVHNVCPCKWTVNDFSDEWYTSSPSFHTKDGYILKFGLEIDDVENWVYIQLLLVEGNRDEQAVPSYQMLAKSFSVVDADTNKRVNDFEHYLTFDTKVVYNIRMKRRLTSMIVFLK